MATIEFGPGLTSSFASRVWGEFNNTGTIASYSLVPIFTYNSTISGFGAYRSFFSVYKGAVPTDFSSLTSRTSRQSDILFTIQNYSTSNFSTLSDLSVNPVTINSVYVTATASGTASWFRMYVVHYYDEIMINQIVGTIGLSGSGADLIMGSTNVVSGKYYRISNLKISLPLSPFTY